MGYRSIAMAVVASIALVLAPISSDAATPKTGASCAKAGVVAVSSGYKYTCTKSGKKLVWGAGQKIASPTPKPIASGEPNPSGSALESPFSVCELQDTRKVDGSPNLASSFTVNSSRVLPTTGEINIAILPFDFSDYPGDGDPSTLTAAAIEKANDWIKAQSNGRLKYNWQTTNKWLRLAKPSKFYNFDEHKDPSTYAQTEQAMAQQYMDAADKTFDLSKIQVAIFIFPKSTDGIPLGGYSHGYTLNSSHGPIKPVYFGGEFNFPTSMGMSDIWMHEIGHFQGVAGHAPGNGSPWHIMANQFGLARVMDAWDSAILGWLDGANLYCFDKAKFTSSATTIQLDSIDGPRTGKIAAFIKVNNSQEIVIESRKPGAYSNLPKQAQGLLAYLVDTSVTNQRCDSCEPSLALDKKQFAYYLRVDNQSPSRGMLQGFYGPPFDLNQLASPGESFTYGDIHIKFVQNGSKDVIEVSRY
jgi:M6 family metalloprotease-like protein